MRARLALATAAFVLLVGSSGFAQEVSATDGRVELPQGGETSTRAYVVVNNPTMYDVYVVSASSEAAATVELRRGEEPSPLREITVPAYGSVAMNAEGVHLRLVGIERTLQAGEKLAISVKTDGNVTLELEATVESP